MPIALVLRLQTQVVPRTTPTRTCDCRGSIEKPRRGLHSTVLGTVAKVVQRLSQEIQHSRKFTLGSLDGFSAFRANHPPPVNYSVVNTSSANRSKLSSYSLPQLRVTVGEAHPMVNRGPQQRPAATDLGPRPRCFPLGSAQSRAAARALLVAREREEVRYQVVSILDGKPANLDGLAELIRAARMKHETGESTDSLPGSERGRERGRGGATDCLAERLRRAEERVARTQAPEATR